MLGFSLYVTSDSTNFIAVVNRNEKKFLAVLHFLLQLY